MSRPKRFWLIAGPHGVGKTIYAFKNVPAVSGSVNFVNLDEIARSLSPLDPRLAEREAARVALARPTIHRRQDGVLDGNHHVGARPS